MPQVPATPPRIIYVSYNGLGTALVRSQVLPYLRSLAGSVAFDLVTYEQAAPPPPFDEVQGITLRKLRYHKRPSLLAKLFDVAAGALTVSWIARTRGAAAIHARSHVAAAAAALAAIISRRPYIFDMRGFLAEEFVEAGAWRAGGLTYRLVRAAERQLLRGSVAIVVLTERAKGHLQSDPRYAGVVRDKEIVVVPCCVDLGRFDTSPTERSHTLVYTGSVGTWYRLDAMISFFAAYRAIHRDARLLIANEGQHVLIREALAASEVADAVDVRAVGFQEIPRVLASCAAGIVLLREGGSKIASSPIKVAEYLAAGLPVVVNEIVGDMPVLLREARAGVVVTDLGREALGRGAAELSALVAEGEEVRRRARALAAATFDVRIGAARYAELYAAISRRS